MRPRTWLAVSLFPALAIGCRNGDDLADRGDGSATTDGSGGRASSGAGGSTGTGASASGGSPINDGGPGSGNARGDGGSRGDGGNVGAGGSGAGGAAGKGGKGAGGKGAGGKGGGSGAGGMSASGGTAGDGGAAGAGGGSAGGGCPLPAYPDASCTGVPAGTRLTVVNGNLEIKTANTVIDGRDVRGCISVQAPGVVIRNSKVSCANFIVISSFGGAYSGAGLLVEDSEIDCQNTSGTAMGDTNFSVRRVNIHGCENGFDLDGTISIEDSYIHDLFQGAEAHTDGAQITPVGHDITIRHNRIYSNEGTSAVISPSVSAGIVSNILIEENLMAGGAYTLYCPRGGPGSSYRVIDNHFSTIFYPKVGAYGPWTDCEDEPELRGNVFHETGQPVPPQ